MDIVTDHRLFERLDVECGVRYSPRGSNKEFLSTTKNISGGGVRITLLKKLDPGTILDLEIFRYNKDSKLRCRGEIVWLWDESFDVGIKFIDQRLLDVGNLIKDLVI